MEMAYIQAENLKHKRTFTKTLIVLAPFVTALMNFFAPLWFQLNSYNWWYILLYPGLITVASDPTSPRSGSAILTDSNLSL